MIEPEYYDNRLTHEDYMELPNDGKRYEIIDGELYVTPAPGANIHQTVLGLLHVWLFSFVRGHSLGRVLVAPVDVVLSEHDVVQPDIVFIGSDRLGIIQREISGPPDLVVEIISPHSGRIDRTVKRKLYASHGVRYYWIVDPRASRVEEYELAVGAYRLRARIQGAAPFEPALFPGLTLPLGELWGEIATSKGISKA